MPSPLPSPDLITSLASNEVFVFGSNRSGRHGKGAAKTALKWGARMGQGEGLMGQTYGLSTKDANIQTLPLRAIQINVDRFIRFATEHPELTFLVTAIGTGLAKLRVADIAPMFRDAPSNVYLPKSFLEVLDKVIAATQGRVE